MKTRQSTNRAQSDQRWSILLLIVIGVTVSFISNISNLENRAYDLFQRYQFQSASDEILLVTVDTRSDGQNNFWTGLRFQELASKLNSMGARLVIGTQPLVLPDVSGEDQILALETLQRQAQRIASLQGGIDPLAEQIKELRKSYDERLALAAQFASANNIVLSAHISNFASENNSIESCAQHAVNMRGSEESVLRGINSARYLVVPPYRICKSIRALGYSNFWPDSDGVIRRADLIIDANGVYLPSLALSASTAGAGNNNDIVVAASNALQIGDRLIRTGPNLQILNRYYQGTFNKPAFAEVTAAAVLAGLENTEIVRDRIVLIGESANSSMPGLVSPIDPHMSTLVLTASNLSNLLKGDYLLRPNWLSWLELGGLFAILLLTLLWVPAMPTIGALLMGIVLSVLIISLEAWFLVSKGIWIKLATVSAYAVAAVWSMHVYRLLRNASSARLPKSSATNTASSLKNELDLEFSVLRQKAPTQETKEKLYDIAMIYTNNREFAQAEKILLHISKLDPNFKDVSQLLNRLSGAQKKAALRRKVAVPAGTLDRRRLGRYEIEKVIGKGAMATVYLGRDPAINRKVAIKTVALAKEFNSEELQDARLQFRREAESAGRLNHPNIIAIYDAGEDDDVSYLAMEYFEGASLLENIAPDNLLPPKWILELGARAAEALDYAHRQNVVHRDIKPANLMYHAATDTLKLTDFGIARLTDSSRTKTGIILGTPSYMSPEQMSAAGVTGQSDLYSLGVTIYQLLTGNAPFRADSIPKLMDKIINEKHKPVCELRADLPACIDAIINKALAKNPADRFKTGLEMALALRECARQFR
jgi:eukaryotic-like serine/threonine-protein kinase